MGRRLGCVRQDYVFERQVRYAGLASDEVCPRRANTTRARETPTLEKRRRRGPRRRFMDDARTCASDVLGVSESTADRALAERRTRSAPGEGGGDPLVERPPYSLRPPQLSGSSTRRTAVCPQPRSSAIRRVVFPAVRRRRARGLSGLVQRGRAAEPLAPRPGLAPPAFVRSRIRSVSSCARPPGTGGGAERKVTPYPLPAGLFPQVLEWRGLLSG